MTQVHSKEEEVKAWSFVFFVLSGLISISFYPAITNKTMFIVATVCLVAACIIEHVRLKLKDLSSRTLFRVLSHFMLGLSSAAFLMLMVGESVSLSILTLFCFLFMYIVALRRACEIEKEQVKLDIDLLIGPTVGAKMNEEQIVSNK